MRGLQTELAKPRSQIHKLSLLLPNLLTSTLKFREESSYSSDHPPPRNFLGLTKK